MLPHITRYLRPPFSLGYANIRPTRHRVPRKSLSCRKLCGWHRLWCVYLPHVNLGNRLFHAGVQLVLYVWCVLHLRSRRKRRGKIMTFLLLYVTILLCLETMFVGAATWTVQEMYINNYQYPGGPWAYFLATQNQPENVMFFASLFVLTFLSDLLVVRSHSVLVHFNISSFSCGDVGLSGNLREGSSLMR